ncbi:MAG TPA: prepilin-type N-terminal cleavage/methylation domain-containing protein [Candidatus Brocadiia bacterium]|nr:prepilin-type N-terminal cleavage/methylation domain-containing protein [Candidatus Brocadiia bacterium]
MGTGRKSACRPRSQRRDGFTLAEMLIVIGVIAVLTGLLLPALLGARKSGRITVAKQECQQIDVGMGLYKNDFGVFPPDFIPASPDPTMTATPDLPCVWAFGGVPMTGTGNNGLNSGECLVFFLGKRYSSDLAQFDRFTNVAPGNVPGNVPDRIPDDGIYDPLPQRCVEADGIWDYFYLAKGGGALSAKPFLATASGGEYINIPTAKLYDHDSDGFPTWQCPFGINEVMNNPDSPASWYSFDNNEADNGFDPGFEPNNKYSIRLNTIPYRDRVRIKDYWGDQPYFNANLNVSPYNRNVTNVNPYGVDIWSPPYEQVEIKTWRSDDPNRPKDYCYTEFWDPTYGGVGGDTTYAGGSGGWFINSNADDLAPLKKDNLHADIPNLMGTNFYSGGGKKK